MKPPKNPEKEQTIQVAEGSRVVRYKWKRVNNKWQWVFKSSDPIKEEWD